MMTPGQYQKLAVRTASPTALSDMNRGLTNWALGLAGEAGEVLALLKGGFTDETSADPDVLTKELGDVLWYIALFCEQCGFDLDHINGLTSKLDYNTPHLALTVAACDVADYVKKVVHHRHDLDKQKLHGLVASCYGHVTMCTVRARLNIYEVMETNIAKLKARYPEGFSTEASVNRKENT